MPVVLVAVGGAAGTLARYWIAVTVGVRTFPWATLAINVAGCFVLAALLAGPAATRWPSDVTTGLGVGLLGGFTTFSTFGWETVTLVRDGRTGWAAAYVALSIVGGLAAAAGGYAVGRSLS